MLSYFRHLEIMMLILHKTVFKEVCDLLYDVLLLNVISEIYA